MIHSALGFSGRIASGKSTVSDLVAARLRLPRVSFRHYLETVARHRGIQEVTREVLQDLGEEEIKVHGFKDFCRAVLGQVNWHPGEAVVIDGIRHKEAAAALREIVAPAEFHLIYLNIDPDVQLERLPRSLPTRKPIQELECHSTEVQVLKDLPCQAELLLDANRTPDDLADEVIRWTRRSDDVGDQFHRLANEWRTAVGPLSSASKIIQHPAYKGIIALGRDAVPLILRELEQKPDHWFAALRAITGEDPVIPEDRGRMDRMAAAWVRWGRDNGFRW
jgi:dephospho-CoA kinase